MKVLASELKKMDAYSGIDYAQRIIKLYQEFPNEEKDIDEYIEKRVYAVAASANEVILKGTTRRVGYKRYERQCLEMV